MALKAKPGINRGRTQVVALEVECSPEVSVTSGVPRFSSLLVPWYIECTRYLVKSISKDLTWNTHTKEILTKVNRTLGFVKRNVTTKTNQLNNY